jgi:hypothetical protein
VCQPRQIRPLRPRVARRGGYRADQSPDDPIINPACRVRVVPLARVAIHRRASAFARRCERLRWTSTDARSGRHAVVGGGAELAPAFRSKQVRPPRATRHRGPRGLQWRAVRLTPSAASSRPVIRTRNRTRACRHPKPSAPRRHPKITDLQAFRVAVRGSRAHDSATEAPAREGLPHRQTRNPALMRDWTALMARPGLEPGTPRFSAAGPPRLNPHGLQA